MNYMLLSPEIVLMLAALVVLLLGVTRIEQRVLGWLSLVALAAATALTLSLAGAGGTLLFGALTVDAFSQFFKLVFLLVAMLVVIASLSYYGKSRHQHEYYCLLLLATVGMMFVASSSDLATLFVGFELASISTYALAAFDREDMRSVEAGFKYFIIGALSSALMLMGISFVYGLTGTTNLQQIAHIVGEGISGSMTLALVLLSAGFGFKMALVPFHMWAPDTYQGAPSVVSSLLAAGSKKMGFAAAFKVFVLALLAIRAEWYVLFAVLAVLTMTYGNLVALSQRSLKRMLAYSSIAQAGYIAIGFVVIASITDVASPEGLSVATFALGSSLFYILSHAFMKGGAFLAVGAVAYMVQRDKSPLLDEDDIEHFAGLSKSSPLMALCISVLMFALAGIPLTAGFMSKLLVFSSAINAGLAWLAIVAILNSALSLWYYARVVKVMYWREPQMELGSVPMGFVVAVVLATLGTVVLGVYPAPFIELAMHAAEALM
ncbi:NADH-quinone oxidoreductase subunit N [Methermicoccus shengliensis]|uniref:NADH-quinone oxidoreductase subunit N n=1 Tax=Methermicoccus shengliensis TaxID=660064 RepID=A0A832VXR6_9EURY|nr:MAG: Proton-translocating NADH-quinone oxidoreductase, chain N [Euryarchaeota archaeon 55_53]KUK30014.1 MAG: Proton-translocating NADH-quinone oxidoreductase chain N [Methanosarcinales archeaon 56_1174]MDN5294905.1 dehydrogenase subunit [Methanosarcinales archaeon]HIH70097.1 NADH-quinone oxidoreductase subunit N [Methermicoccus shengliensis]